jgi:hypothetical protein
VDHSILLLSLLCWRLAMDSCHGLVVAPTDEHLKPRRARAGTVLWSSLLRRRMGPQENMSPWEMEAACGTAERGTFSRRRWCLNGISASPPPALVPGRLGKARPAHVRLILAPYRQMSTLLQQRHSQPHACPPRIGRCAWKRGRRGGGCRGRV